MPEIKNPILQGFNPDPSILRVGDDYYIATSTFEWFPGVQIHHSRDLIHWRLLTRPLRRASQLNMLGDPDSCGIWAPCLSHADGDGHGIARVQTSDIGLEVETDRVIAQPEVPRDVRPGVTCPRACHHVVLVHDDDLCMVGPDGEPAFDDEGTATDGGSSWGVIPRPARVLGGR